MLPAIGLGATGVAVTGTAIASENTNARGPLQIEEDSANIRARGNNNPFHLEEEKTVDAETQTDFPDRSSF